MSLRAFVSDFVTFWVVVDPFAVLPVFLALTARYPPAERRRIALEAILVAAVVVGFFIGFGQLIIEAIGLSIRAFQIAVMDQIQTGISAAVVLAITLGMLLAAGPIMRAIGLGGANVLRRIMGMILAALAVNTVLGGLGDWLGLPRL